MGSRKVSGLLSLLIWNFLEIQKFHCCIFSIQFYDELIRLPLMKTLYNPAPSVF